MARKSDWSCFAFARPPRKRADRFSAGSSGLRGSLELRFLGLLGPGRQSRLGLAGVLFFSFDRSAELYTSRRGEDEIDKMR